MTHLSSQSDAPPNQRKSDSCYAVADAYPVDVFPPPDLLRAHALLQQGGMTLDSISAHVGRHITEGIGKLAREALAVADAESGADGGA